MKNSTYFQFVLVVSLLIVLISPRLDAQMLDFSEINISDGTRIETKINGLNMGGYTYGLINEQGPSMSIPDECVQCFDFDCPTAFPRETITGFSFESMNTKSNFLEKSKELAPSSLRFPGGTHSGWYHYYKYNEQGIYDAANPKVAKGYGMNVGETIYLPNAQKYCQEDSKLLVDQNYIDGFINYAKALNEDSGKKMTISYVVNLLTHFRFRSVNILCLKTCGKSKSTQPMSNYDCMGSMDISFEDNESLFDDNINKYKFELYYRETQDAIQHIIEELELGPNDDFFVEMGNEYYDNTRANAGYHWLVYDMNANNYAALVEIYSERLKCHFDGVVNIKTALVAHSNPNQSWQSANSILDPNTPGLVNIMNRDVTGDGRTLDEVTDGLILHAYYHSSDCLDIDEIEARFECGRIALTNYIQNDLNKALDYFRTDFPGKEIWLTEWNIVGGDKSRNVSYINTLLHAAFVQEYAMEIVDYNSKHNNIITLSNHHRIGFDQPWSILQVEDGNNEMAIFRATAYPFLNLKELGTEFDYLGDIKLTDGSYILPDLGQFKAFYMGSPVDTSEKIHIFYSNKTENDIEFELPLIIKDYQINEASYSDISGDFPFSYGKSNTTHGQNKYINSIDTFLGEEVNGLGFGNINDQLVYTEDQELLIGALNIIDPYSVGMITLEISPIVSNKEPFAGFKDIKVFPNPANDLFKVEFYSAESEDIDFYLYNAFGEVVKHKKESINYGNNDLSCNVSTLPSGIYFIKLRGSLNSVQRKVIIQ